MAKKRLIPAVGYARRSTDLQERSIPDQQAYVEKWAAEHGYRIVRWYIDDAISGTSARGRNAFEQLIAAAENGRDFDCILCYDISRFSRGGTNETGYYLHRLRLAGVEVVFTADGIPEGDEGELLQGVKSWQAKQFSVKLSRDVIRGHVSGMMTDRSVQGGRAPYGYDLQYVSRDGRVLRTIRRLADGTKQEFDPQGRCVRTLPAGERVGKAKSDVVRLVPGDPAHVKTVQRIFATYLDGVGYRSIALALNADGIPAPNGGRWLVAAVKDILTNRAYTGSLVWNRSTSGKIHTVSGDGRAVARAERKRLRRKPQDQWIVIDDVHELLVSRQEFERVQAETQRRAGLGGKARPTQRYLLSGLLKCLHCRYAFTGKRLGRGDYRPRYYLDGGHHRYGNQVCRHKQIPAKALEAWVVGQVRNVLLGDAKTIDAAIDAFVRAVRGRTPQQSGGKDFERELAAVHKRIQATAAMLADPDLGEVDEIRQSLVTLKARRDALQARAKQVAAPAQRGWTDGELRTWAKGTLAALDEALVGENATPAARAVLAAFVDRIEIEHKAKRGTLFIVADAAEVLALADTTRVGNGERTKMVYSFPTNEKLWAKYAEIRAEGLRAERGLTEATAFYRAHRQAMDEGAVVAWPERHNHDELSAVQHAMNLRLQDERAFWAEYQNEPLPEDDAPQEDLSADAVAAKFNRLRRGEVPVGANHLTMFVDVQQALLFYVVCAWEADFTGYVVDYGTYPDQRRPFFTLRDAQPTLSQMAKGAGLEGTIYAGLEALTGSCLTREWRRDDGAMMRIERCLIDANWGNSTDVVYQFCRQSAHSSVVMPSHGRFVGASSVPFSEYRRKLGDRLGHNWRIPSVQGKRAVRHVVFDTNYWKSFIYARLAVPMGDRGCLSLFGDNANAHRLLAEHLTAEYRVKTEGRGRTVDEWKLRPSAVDNHWFDCLVGCAVAASMQGATLPEMNAKPTGAKPRLRLSDLQRSRR